MLATPIVHVSQLNAGLLQETPKVYKPGSFLVGSMDSLVMNGYPYFDMHGAGWNAGHTIVYPAMLGPDASGPVTGPCMCQYCVWCTTTVYAENLSQNSGQGHLIFKVNCLMIYQYLAQSNVS